MSTMKRMIIEVVLVLSLCTSEAAMGAGAGAEAQLRRALACGALPGARLAAAPALLRDLQRALRPRWPDCRLFPFGSTELGVAIRNSDVDVYVELPGAPPSYSTVAEAQELLARHPLIFHRVYTIPNASVPIVKFTHAPTGFRGDVNFVSADVIRKTEMLKYLLHLDERARSLAILVKYWALLHKPPLQRRYMPNYAIVHLVVFYLQQRAVLPPVFRLQENATSVMVDGWETGFHDIPFSTTNNETLFDLTRGFFKFYANFDFLSTIVSPFAGTAIERRLFESLDTVPQIFHIYIENVANNNMSPLNTSLPACIQDFLQHRHNVAAATGKELLNLFQTNLKLTSGALAEGRHHFIEDIFNDDQCWRASNEQVLVDVQNSLRK